MKSDRFMLQSVKRRKERAQTTTWLTPPWLLERLGEFDLDPCSAPEPRPWPTAKMMYSEINDGLAKKWFGRVFVNPPYGLSAKPFIAKLARYGAGSGVLLVTMRADTNYFHEYVWGVAKCMLVIKRRVNFYTIEGVESSGDTGGASVLFGYGDREKKTLSELSDIGYFTNLDER